MRRLIIVLLAIILFTSVYLFLGFYNVSALKEHSKVVEMMFHSISESSIKRNAKDVVNPYDINDEKLYVKGFEEYDEMCAQCHGWDGVEPSPTGKGLNPKPPHFPREELYEYTLEDIFWVTKNGVKMTGMPAYGPTHDDETVWTIAIFLDRSRDLSEDGYKRLKRKYSK